MRMRLRACERVKAQGMAVSVDGRVGAHRGDNRDDGAAACTVPGERGRCCRRISTDRTEGDAKRLLGQGIRIRLCKGAYDEGPEVTFPAKRNVDANYVKLMKRMATSGVFCGIATHDEAIVEEMRRFARAQGIQNKSTIHNWSFSVVLVVVVGEGSRAMARLSSRASLNSCGVR